MRTVLFAMASVITLCSCAHPSPNWLASFGDTSRNLRASQVIDPDAPSRMATARGIDGKAAAGALKTYAETFGYAVKETKQPAVSISTSVGAR